MLYRAIAVILFFAMVSSVRLAVADYEASQSDLPSVIEACRLAPSSATYWLRASTLREIDRPDDPSVDADIAHALALNPRFTEAWMQRALRDELHGRAAEAERDYLDAARVDHMYKPAWALANFYIRQGDNEKFWRYARKCLEIVEPRRLEPASYDPSPVFDLAWRVSQDAAEIRRRLIPPRHFILADYLDYLGAHNQLDAGAEIAKDLASFADPQDNFYLLNFCERLINLSKGEAAVRLWNAMVDHGLVQSEKLDAAAGQSLTNADLKRSFQRVGFDWRLPAAEGVLHSHFPDSGEVHFEFSGDQPENVVVLYQNLPVRGGNAYRLSFQYRTLEMDHTDGLRWRLWDYAGLRNIPASGQLMPAQDWSIGDAWLHVPRGVSLVRLDLVYRREIGTTRIRGTVAFRRFALQLKGTGAT